MGLSLPVCPSEPAANVSKTDPDPPAGLDASELFNVDELDDYVEEGGRLELVDPPRLYHVIVEACGDHFWVSRLRDNGSTSAMVRWTRDELLELQARIAGALEM
jgi:hypothetical protein